MVHLIFLNFIIWTTNRLLPFNLRYSSNSPPKLALNHYNIHQIPFLPLPNQPFFYLMPYYPILPVKLTYAERWFWGSINQVIFIDLETYQFIKTCCIFYQLTIDYFWVIQIHLHFEKIQHLILRLFEVGLSIDSSACAVRISIEGGAIASFWWTRLALEGLLMGVCVFEMGEESG